MKRTHLAFAAAGIALGITGAPPVHAGSPTFDPAGGVGGAPDNSAYHHIVGPCTAFVSVGSDAARLASTRVTCSFQGNVVYDSSASRRTDISRPPVWDSANGVLRYFTPDRVVNLLRDGASRLYAETNDTVIAFATPNVDGTTSMHVLGRPASEAWIFDASGLLKENGEASNRRSYAYDADNRLVKVTAGSEQMSYVYESDSDAIRSVTGPIGSFEYTYDGAAQVMRISWTDSAGQALGLHLEYDISGFLQEAYFDDGVNPEVSLVHIDYADERGTVAEMHSGDPDSLVRFSVEPSRLTVLNSANAATRIVEFDDGRWVAQESPDGRAFAEWYPNNQLKSVTTEDGKQQTFNYGALGLVERIDAVNAETGAATTIVENTYNGFGQPVTQIGRNRTTVTRTYNSDGEPLSAEEQPPTQMTVDDLDVSQVTVADGVLTHVEMTTNVLYGTWSRTETRLYDSETVIVFTDSTGKEIVTTVTSGGEASTEYRHLENTAFAWYGSAGSSGPRNP